MTQPDDRRTPSPDEARELSQRLEGDAERAYRWAETMRDDGGREGAALAFGNHAINLREASEMLRSLAREVEALRAWRALTEVLRNLNHSAHVEFTGVGYDECPETGCAIYRSALNTEEPTP